MKEKKGDATLKFILVFGGVVLLLAGITVVWEFFPWEKTDNDVEKNEVDIIEVCLSEVDFGIKMCRNVLDEHDGFDEANFSGGYKVSIDNFGFRRIDTFKLKFYESYNKVTVKTDIFSGAEPDAVTNGIYTPEEGEAGESGNLLLVEAIPMIKIDGKVYTCGASHIRSYGSISRDKLFDECV